MHKARQAKYRFGTTGTLDGSQTHELVLQGLFGKIFKGKKLTKISPNKTISGAIGSLILSFLLVPIALFSMI